MIEEYLQLANKFADATQDLIKNDLKINSAYYRSIFERELFSDKQVKISGRVESSSKNDLNKLDLFLGFMDIINAYEILCDYEIYISKRTFKEDSSLQERYLIHLIESYINDTTIFRNMLNKYFNYILKKYKNSTKIVDIKSLKTKVDSTFKNIVDARNTHTHLKRFSSDINNDLSKFSTLNILNSIELDLTTLQEETYNKQQKKWKKTIKDNNGNILILLNFTSKEICKFIFTKSGRVRSMKD